MGFVSGVGSAAVAHDRGVKGPCPSNLHWAAWRSSAGGIWTTNSGHHCGEVWHQNIFTGGLHAATKLQSCGGYDMGYILNKHELRVSILCNHELGISILCNHELWGLCLRQGPQHHSTVCDHKHTLIPTWGAAFSSSSPLGRASNPAHKLFQPLQEFIAAYALLDSFRVALLLPYAFIFLHSL